jgi:dihydroorotate dehydrogenase electron transfer subunit
MRQLLFEIKENRPLTKDIMEMILAGDTSDITRPGQFVNIKLDGLYLRRPISICDAEEGKLTLIYKVVGKGTEQMRDMTEGTLDILSSLGNGYDTSISGEKPLLIGGGVGVPPLYMLAKELIKRGKTPYVALGFADAKSVFYKEEFEKLGLEVSVATVDGTFGTKGFVTDCIRNDFSDAEYVFTCGPEPMLKAIYDLKLDGQFSFEERMGCGFGACMGCSCKTKYGNKRICKDGPVLKAEEIIW